MGIVAFDPVLKLEKHGSRVPVGGDRRTKSQIPNRLEKVVKMVKSLITFFPALVAKGKDIWSEGTQAKEVVAAIHHHVDGEVVTRKYMKIRAEGIPEQQSFPFSQPV